MMIRSFLRQMRSERLSRIVKWRAFLHVSETLWVIDKPDHAQILLPYLAALHTQLPVEIMLQQLRFVLRQQP